MVLSSKTLHRSRKPRSCTPGVLIQQWQWEATLDSLRRHVPESLLRTHWEPTGILEIDATARAHIAEWALFSGLVPWPRAEDVIESLIFDALRTTHWDLYVVEDSTADRLVIRGLRDPRGFVLRWWEGRELLPPGETLALRPAFLELQGLHLSTLPLRLRACHDPSAVLFAILQAYGRPEQNASQDWRAFMAGQGSRILLEYTLTHLQHRAEARRSSLETTANALSELHQVFLSLERSLPRDSPPLRSSDISDRCFAILDVGPPSPSVLVFATREDQRRYLQAASNPSRRRSSSTGDVSWIRIHRARPEELHPVEWELSRQAGIDAAREGMIRIDRRSASGLYLDPSLDDYQLLISACRELARKRRNRAA